MVFKKGSIQTSGFTPKSVTQRRFFIGKMRCLGVPGYCTALESLMNTPFGIASNYWNLRTLEAGELGNDCEKMANIF